MKRLFTLVATSLLGVLLSAQAFASLNMSVTGDTVISGTVNNTAFTGRGVSLFADYQIVNDIPVTLGVAGSFHTTTVGNQNEIAPTGKIWLSSDITGVAALQPYVRGGYAFSWVTPAAGTTLKSATNHGLLLNVGNTITITETVSAVVAYTFNMRNYSTTGTNENLTSHGASLGFSAELM